MTSKHLFFKVMKEDLRHRIWMVALSALASFLAFPVMWLLYRTNLNNSVWWNTEERMNRLVGVVMNFVGADSAAVGGCIVLCGALIAALAGFKFLFHKNQIDNWHSMPVKRNVLYGACYLNGILVWMVPILAGMVLMGIMAGSFVIKYAGGAVIGSIAWILAKNLFLMTVLFLLVYNLTLVAVMLCGNVLNTFISLLIMGFGVISIYGLGTVMCEWYLENYCWLSAGGEWKTYASPLFSAAALLVNSVEDAGGGGSLLVNLLIALALGVFAWVLYLRRPSELAEQGIRNRFASAVFKFVTATAAGVCGWLIFCAITNMETGILWGIFGAVLMGMLAFGVLDVCFQMEFKAFFAHKLQMALAVAASLVICFSFYNGLFGYDSYLPDKEDIAEIGICHSSLSNRCFSSGVLDEVVNKMAIRNQDAAYAFLERVTQWDAPRDSESGLGFIVRVTLKSGRTYYRSYWVYGSDRDVLWPLVTDEEYLKAAYLLDDEALTVERASLYRVDKRYSDRALTQEEGGKLMAAYNQDVLENANALLSDDGRVLVQVNLSAVGENSQTRDFELEIYDFMENTVKALRDMGYDEYVSEADCFEIESVRLALGCYVEKGISAEELMAKAEEHYYGSDANSGEQKAEAAAEIFEKDGIIYSDDMMYWEPVVVITDKAEIEELLQLFDYVGSYRSGNAFGRKWVFAEADRTDGSRIDFHIREGALPEKYILRFGELAEEKSLPSE